MIETVGQQMSAPPLPTLMNLNHLSITGPFIHQNVSLFLARGGDTSTEAALPRSTRSWSKSESASTRRATLAHVGAARRLHATGFAPSEEHDEDCDADGDRAVQEAAGIHGAD
jgi:hypothetical protein